MTSSTQPGLIELEPCPFCGADEASIFESEDGLERATFTVYCDHCHASAATELDATVAGNVWNTRPALLALLSTQARQIEAASKALEFYTQDHPDHHNDRDKQGYGRRAREAYALIEKESGR